MEVFPLVDINDASKRSDFALLLRAHTFSGAMKELSHDAALAMGTSYGEVIDAAMREGHPQMVTSVNMLDATFDEYSNRQRKGIRQYILDMFLSQEDAIAFPELLYPTIDKIIGHTAGAAMACNVVANNKLLLPERSEHTEDQLRAMHGNVHNHIQNARNAMIDWPLSRRERDALVMNIAMLMNGLLAPDRRMTDKQLEDLTGIRLSTHFTYPPHDPQLQPLRDASLRNFVVAYPEGIFSIHNPAPQHHYMGMIGWADSACTSGLGLMAIQQANEIGAGDVIAKVKPSALTDYIADCGLIALNPSDTQGERTPISAVELSANNERLADIASAGLATRQKEALGTIVYRTVIEGLAIDPVRDWQAHDRLARALNVGLCLSPSTQIKPTRNPS